MKEDPTLGDGDPGSGVLDPDFDLTPDDEAPAETGAEELEDEDEGAVDDQPAEGDQPADGDQPTQDSLQPEGDDDLPDDPAALKALVRQSHQLMQRMAAGGGRSAPAPQSSADPMQSLIEDALQQMAKDPKNPSGVLIAHLIDKTDRLERMSEMQRQLERRLDEQKTPAKIRGLVRQVVLERGIDPQQAELLVLGALQKRRMLEKRNVTQDREEPRQRSAAPPNRQAPARRTAVPARQSLKPVRPVERAADGGSAETVTVNGFKMRKRYTASEYASLQDRLQSSGKTEAAAALMRANRDGVITVR